MDKKEADVEKKKTDVNKKADMDKKQTDADKKKTDVKFIVGMVILVAVMAVMCGSFWKVVSMQAAKDKEDEARQEQEAIRDLYRGRRWTEGAGICGHDYKDCIQGRYSI